MASVSEFDIPRYIQTLEQRYRMIGAECGDCDAKMFPPREVCGGCGGKTIDKFKFSGKGEVSSFTTVEEVKYAPEKFVGVVPYVMALVKLEEGPTITAQLTDLEAEVVIGMPVEMVTRKLYETGSEGERGLVWYSYMFRPYF